MGYLLYDPLFKLACWLLVIGLCIILAIIFFLRASRAREKNSPPSVAKINRGFAFFFIALALVRVLFSFSDFERDVNNLSLLYNTYVMFSYLTALIGISLLAYLVDTYMLENRRKTLTWISVLIIFVNTAFIILTLTTQAIPLIIPRVIIYGSTGLVFVIVIVVYGGLARQTAGKLRRNAIISLVGVAIAVLGTLLDSDFLAQAGLVPIFIPPIIMLAGLIIFALGQRGI